LLDAAQQSATNSLGARAGEDNEISGRGGIGRRACLRCMYLKFVEVQQYSKRRTAVDS
jgi:hypothetical protein